MFLVWRVRMLGGLEDTAGRAVYSSEVFDRYLY